MLALTISFDFGTGMAGAVQDGIKSPPRARTRPGVMTFCRRLAGAPAVGAEDRGADARMGGTKADRLLEKSARIHMLRRPSPVRLAISRNSAKCNAGSSSSGGTHIRPAIGKLSRRGTRR